ncbi:acyltransferase [Legionella birminghamensis]|uniref:Acyltransferase n=1 Tax=Legionella birminghamensis TaxID=28083 RepID=A0A378I7D7_9GAMM|nr:acyltransferase [Legionella birminghamensis]STX30943.1 acyltransferase [Legionella birminghamensis]
MAKGAQKIWFLQLIRSVGCVLVIYTHWFGLITTPNAIHQMIFQDPITDYPNVQLNEYLTIISSQLGLTDFRAGFFSLGLFFLLSGYIIPFSLKNSTPFTYLVRRVFRIYPTAIVCLIIAASTITIANHYTGSSLVPDVFHPKVLIANLLLIRDVLHTHHIERALWTLEIEMHFYLLFFIFFYFAIERKVETFLISAVIMLLASRFFIYFSDFFHDDMHKLVKGFGNLLAMNSSYITYMFVGTAFYYTLSKQWSVLTGITTTLLMMLLNYFCLNTGTILNGTGNLIFINHCFGIVMFLLLYRVNDRIPYNKYLNHFAEISYPLYLLHGFTGYTLYFLIYPLTLNVPLAAAISLSLVFLLANLVHFTVEKPSMTYSKNYLKARENRSRVVAGDLQVTAD